MIVCYPLLIHSSIVNKLMQKVSNMSKHATIFQTVWVRYSWPVEFKKTTIFSFINISIIYPLNSLNLKSKKMFNGHLRMWMPKTISCPSYFGKLSKLFIHPVMSQSILIKNIIDIANSLIILYPSPIGDLKLTIFDQLFDNLLTRTW